MIVIWRDSYWQGRNKGEGKGGGGGTETRDGFVLIALFLE